MTRRPKKGEAGYAEYRARENARNKRRRREWASRSKEARAAWRKAHREEINAYMRAYLPEWHRRHPGYLAHYQAEYARRPEVKARKAEYNRRVWARIVDSYELHDAVCERRAMDNRRAGRVKTPFYTPHRGMRIPPSWMRRPCELYAPGGRGLEGDAYARELAIERRDWIHRRNLE